MEVRCRNHLHHKIDITPVIDWMTLDDCSLVIEIKCQHCGRKQKRTVLHTYTTADILSAAQRGRDVLWIDRPEQ